MCRRCFVGGAGAKILATLPSPSTELFVIQNKVIIHGLVSRDRIQPQGALPACEPWRVGWVPERGYIYQSRGVELGSAGGAINRCAPSPRIRNGINGTRVRRLGPRCAINVTTPNPACTVCRIVCKAGTRSSERSETVREKGACPFLLRGTRQSF